MTWSDLSGGGTARVYQSFIDEYTTETKGYAEGPERDLLSAVLFDAVQSYLAFLAEGRSNGSEHREAYSWVHSEEEGYVFSFKNVCDGLGIDPSYLRLGLANVRCSRVLKGRRRRAR